MIKAHFSPLTNPSPKRLRPAFDVPEHLGTSYTVVRTRRPSLFGDRIDARLAELDQRENLPFSDVGAGRQLFETPRTKDEVLLQAFVPNDGVTSLSFISAPRWDYRQSPAAMNAAQ